MSRRRTAQLAHAALTDSLARGPASVAALRERVRTLRGPIAEAEERLAVHRAEVLRALTREHGGTYAADGLRFAAWSSVGQSFLASPGVTKLDEDLTAALIAGDEARVAELRGERVRNAETIATAAAVRAGLTRKVAELQGAAGAALVAWSSALRAELFAPIPALRAKLAAAEAEAEASYQRQVAELG